MGELCLVCCSKVPKLQDAQTHNLLDSNLFVIFLLKQVLQVPDSQLEENLKESGNPVEWIRLCAQCTQLASQALNLHCQIVKLDRELWSVQKLIVEKTKQSSTQLVASNQSENIWARTRNFVKNFACHQAIGSLPINPFIQGDKLATANYYSSQQISEKPTSTLIVKIEQLNPQAISDHEDNNNDDDWQMEDNDSDQVNLKPPKKKPINHPRRTKVNGKWKCNFCSKLFHSSSGCSKHEHEKHASIPNQYTCQLCGKAWNSREYLRKHMARMHKVHLNDDRASISKRRGQVRGLHLTRQIKTEPVIPEEAGNLEERGAGLSEIQWDKAHLKMNKKPPKEPRLRVNGKVKCYHCDKLFSKASGCFRHESEIHPSIPAQFPCDICGKAWNSREYLTTHKRTVHKIGGLPKTDPTLKLEDGDGDDYAVEMSPQIDEVVSDAGVEDNLDDCQLDNANGTDKKHSEDEEDVGNKTKKGNGKLKVERKTREKDEDNGKKRCTRFSCRVCGKVFKDRYHLQRHERNLRGKKESEKGFSCDLCESRFVSRGCFNWHKVQTHGATFARKFEWVDGKVKCGQCDKLLASPSCLLRHEKVRHPKNPAQFICDLCGKTWDCYEYFKNHRKKAHGVRADGSPYVSRSYKRKKKMNDGREGYGQPIPGGEGVRGRKYEAVDGKLKCRSCDRLFVSPDGAYKHEQEKHPKIPASFICTTCGMAFNSLEYLRGHSKIKHWLKLDGTQYIPHWVPTRKYKWKKSEN